MITNTSKIDNIGFLEVTDERVKSVDFNNTWNYCELCVTPRCNFSCQYCNRFQGELSKELKLSDIHRILSIISTNFYPQSYNLRYIQFTGGEPTVREDICDIVIYAKRVCRSRVGMSTNGSASIDLYKKLIDYGVELFGISLDAKSEDVNSKMIGRNNYFDIVSKNIKEIAKTTHVAVGVVINDENINDAEQIIRYVSDLGVNDIKIGTSSHYNKLVDINLSDELLSKHPILNYRISNFKNKRNMRGVCGSDCKHCWMALDDLAIVGEYHFPCMVYARERGQFIGRVSSTKVMKQERLEWVKTHNCKEDPICSKYCMDFKVDYNNKFMQINKNIEKFLN